MKRIQVTLEMEVSESALKEVNITNEELLKGIIVVEDDMVDGCKVSTDISGIIPTADFLLGDCRLVAKKLLSGPFVDDNRQEIRDAIREDIDLNGETCYAIPSGKVKDLIETLHPAVEEIAENVHRRMSNRGQTLDEAVNVEVESYFATHTLD